MRSPRKRRKALSISAKRKRPLAQSPGSLVHRGEKRSESANLRLMIYDEDHCEETILTSFPAEGITDDPEKVTWLHFTGLHEVEEVRRIGEAYGLSGLTLEDILHTNSRSKVENRSSSIFIVTRLVTHGEIADTIDIQHFSLVLLSGNRVLTFSESPATPFDPVVQRIKTNIGGRIRKHKADYLTWALIDAVVDNYLSVLDQLDDTLISMDERLQDNAADVDISELYNVKRDIHRLQRIIRPIREIAGSLLRDDAHLITDETTPYFFDLNDHAIQAIETAEFLRESSTGLRDYYLSAASNRMNEVMKVLTCFSTIFLPLTFIAGVYGMNFDVMPELHYPWAYPAVWGLFALCAIGMLWLFRRMKWM